MRPSDLRLGDVDRLVENKPRDRLVTGGHGGGALVGHVVGGGGQKLMQ